MGCGMGGCYSCVVLARPSTGLGTGPATEIGTPHHTRTCIEGPVFDAQRVVWVIPTPKKPRLDEMPRDFFKELAVFTILKLIGAG